MSNIEELLENITRDPSKVHELSEEQIRAVEAKTSPYGVVTPEKDQHFTFSIINLREEYMKKILMTSLVSYLFRVSEEYVPEYESPHSKSEIKYHISKFLNRAFNFNPDLHVRSATKPLEKPTSAQFAEIRAKCGQDKVGSSIVALSAKVAELPENVQETASTILSEASSALEGAYRYSKEASETLRGLMHHTDVSEGMLPALVRAQVKLESHAEALSSVHFGTRASLEESTKDVRPPAEIFYNWERFHNNHYEVFRELVAALYYDLPDIEFAIQLYSAHENEAGATEFVKRNQGKVITDIITAQNGAWTLLGPFRQNRERVDFYTKETEVIKKLFDQAEQDKALAKDLVKKRVSKEKAKNIKEMGPDDKGLEEYTKVRGIITDLESKQNLTKEEKKQLEDAVRQKEMMEVPDDAIQVDVFHTDQDGAFKRDKIYTAAEQPEPPKQPENARILTSRTGEKMTMQQLKDNISE